MRCIITRYRPATNTRGARYEAVADTPAGLCTLLQGANYALDETRNHANLAEVLAASLEEIVIASAPLPKGAGWAHITQEVSA